MSDINIKILIDGTGRTIIGELVEDTETQIVLKNAATIYVQPNEAGQLQVQTIPLFFKEFMTLDGREQGVDYRFNKSQVTETNAGDILDNKLIIQYEKIKENITAPDEPQATPENTEDVVKLFDD